MPASENTFEISLFWAKKSRFGWHEKCLAGVGKLGAASTYNPLTCLHIPQSSTYLQRTILMAKTTSDPIVQAGEKLEELWSRQEIVPWREMERFLRIQYFTFVRRNSHSDAEAARKLGLAPPNYYRMCKELGLK